MVISLILAALAQAAVAAPDDSIIITAPYARLRSDLERCEKGGCGTIEDIKASVRFAEAAFRKGDYTDARTALRKSVLRNRDAAPQHPEAVSNLYYAQARVAQHYGDQSEYAKAAYDSYRVLREHRPDNQDRFRAEMEVGDMLLSRGEGREADRTYAAGEARASAAGAPKLAAAFTLRRAWVDYLGNNKEGAKRRLDALAAEAPSPSVATAARVLRARIARREGDEALSDRLIAAVEAQPAAAPVLIHQPDMADLVRDPRRFGNDPLRDINAATAARSSDLTSIEWVDVGFWIRPDGSVADAEFLRGRGERRWARPVLALVSGRRYAPVRADPGEPGTYRVERFTATADFITPAGSVIRRRAGAAKVVSQDLSTETVQRD